MGIYPKSDIVSGGGVKIPNKKIIIPKQISVQQMDLLNLTLLNVQHVEVMDLFTCQM
ncbi:MAG: hypothetical protein CM15mV5_0370 [uncultured marine virus]|nr:MAG: hypothetical protein CM15mV5_0370 [uncultured marine virus]